jgi:hypothetical protein
MIHHFASGAAALRKALERVCPACGTKQTVATENLHATVACTKCGQPVPPKTS